MASDAPSLGCQFKVRIFFLKFVMSPFLEAPELPLRGALADHVVLGPQLCRYCLAQCSWVALDRSPVSEQWLGLTGGGTSSRNARMGVGFPGPLTDLGPTARGFSAVTRDAPLVGEDPPNPASVPSPALNLHCPAAPPSSLALPLHRQDPQAGSNLHASPSCGPPTPMLPAPWGLGAAYPLVWVLSPGQSGQHDCCFGRKWGSRVQQHTPILA